MADAAGKFMVSSCAGKSATRPAKCTPINPPRQTAETPATAVQRMVLASEDPPLHAAHPDRERIEKLPVPSSSELIALEPVDFMKLADAGEKLLDTSGSWILAVEPLVRELECVMHVRGQPSNIMA